MITKKQFLSGDFPRILKVGLERHPITMFFLKHQNNAFKVVELSEMLTTPKTTIRSTLKRLKKESFILHKTPWFMINPGKVRKLSKRNHNKK